MEEVPGKESGCYLYLSIRQQLPENKAGHKGEKCCTHNGVDKTTVPKYSVNGERYRPEKGSHF